MEETVCRSVEPAVDPGYLARTVNNYPHKLQPRPEVAIHLVGKTVGAALAAIA